MSLSHHQHVRIRRHEIARRSFLHQVSAGALAAGTLNFTDLMSLRADELRKQGRSMILLWMTGGPSQFETFSPRPGTENGGPTQAIETAVPGINIAGGWEKTAARMQDIAIIRSMTNKEGNHRRATYQMHTAYAPSGSVKHPSLAASIAKEIGNPEHDLPSVVSIGRTTGAGFLGVDYEPFNVDRPGELPRNVASAVDVPRYQRRLGLLDRLEDDFAARGGKQVVSSHRRLYGKASKMVLSTDVKAFDISDEPDSLLQSYGDTNFGRGCLLARRLIEAGTTFVEVKMGGWDTHQDNFERVSKLAAQVDPATATLIGDLKDRGMLEKTLVVWMGEFGRTPKITPRTGRNHFPKAFNVALAGGGVKGGQVIGSTTDDGMAVDQDPVQANDLFCSICHSLNVDPQIENMSPLGRPMKIVDGGKFVEKLFS